MKKLKFGFPKDSRLLTKSDFENLRIDSRSFRKECIRVIFKKNSRSTARLGISVSKKAGNSVVRNTLKRIFKESFRTSKINALGMDVLVLYVGKKLESKASIDRSFIAASINQCFNKLLNQNSNSVQVS